MWAPSGNGEVPHGAVQAGIDKDGQCLYVGRAFHEGDNLPAKVAPAHGGAFVAWGGEEHAKFHYEVLISSAIAWQPCHGNAIPHNAVEGGLTRDGEKLFIGRVMHDGTFTPGKVQPSHGVLYISYAGQEMNFKDYEILVHI